MTSNHLLLYHIAELMLEHEQHILPVDLLFDDEQIGDFVKSIQIDSPYQQMLFEGVLTESVRDEKLFVSFTVEGYFHYVVGEVIYNQTNGKGPECLEKIVEDNKMNGAKEGVEQCLRRDVFADDLTRLMWLIDVGGKVLDMCSIPLASAFLVIKGTAKTKEEKLQLQHKQVKVVFKQLFEDATDNDIYVLDNSIDFLDSAQQNKIVEIIYLNINETVKPYNLKKAIIYLNSIQYILKDKREEQLNNILQNEFEADDYELLSLFYNQIAGQFDFISKYDKAIEYYEKSLAIRLKVHGEQHPSTGKSYNNLGLVNYGKGKYKKAIGYYEKTLAIDLKVHGEQHSSTGISYNNLGLVYYGKGEYKKAIEYYEKTLAIDLKVHGEQHSSTGISYNNLGCAFLEIGENDRAIEYHEKSLAIRLKVHGVEHPSTGESYNNLGCAFSDKDEYDKAIDYHEKSLAIRLKVHGEEHPSIGDSYNNLGWIFEKIGQYDKAIKYYEKSLVMRLKVHGEQHPFTGKSYNNLGSAFEKIGQYGKAIVNFENLLKIQLKELGKENKFVSNSYFSIGIMHQNLNNFVLAIENYQKGFLIEKKGGFPFKIAQCYQGLEEPKKALDYFIQSAEIRKEDIGFESDATQEAIANAKRLAKELGKEHNLPEWMN